MAQNLNDTEIKIFTNSNLNNLVVEINYEIKKMLNAGYYLASSSIALDNEKIVSQLVFRKYAAATLQKKQAGDGAEI